MNPFGIYVGNLWQEKYVYIQSIFDFYVIMVNYCTFCFVLFLMMKELEHIIVNCNEDKVKTHIHIQRRENAFVNVQQMLTQLPTFI
jgi:hypothetical protein